MNRHLFRDLLENNTDLLLRMLKSNAPASPSVPKLPHWVVEQADVMRALRRNADLNTKPTSAFWDYAKGSERLALLPHEALEHVALCVAVALLSETIAKVLDRASVQMLKKALGETIYNYALSRGRYQVHALKRHFNEYAKNMPLEVRCQFLARALLETIRATWPEALQMHTKALFQSLKLPQASPLVDGNANALDVTPLWHLMRKILLRELQPQWTSYFV